MAIKLSQDEIDDLRRRLELVYARPVDEAEAIEIADRLYRLYEELKGL